MDYKDSDLERIFEERKTTLEGDLAKSMIAERAYGRQGWARAAENASLADQYRNERDAANLQVRDLQENVRRIAKGAGEEWMKRQLCTLVESFAQKQEHETNWADTHRAGDNDEQPTKARCECCPKCGLNIPGGCPVEDHAHAWCKCVEKRIDRCPKCGGDHLPHFSCQERIKNG